MSRAVGAAMGSSALNTLAGYLARALYGHGVSAVKAVRHPLQPGRYPLQTVSGVSGACHPRPQGFVGSRARLLSSTVPREKVMASMAQAGCRRPVPRA